MKPTLALASLSLIVIGAYKWASSAYRKLKKKNRIRKPNIRKEQSLSLKYIREEFIDLYSDINVLSQEEALNRSRFINNVTYTIALALSEKPTYEGNILICFDCKGKCKDLFIDYKGECIYYALLNGQRIYLPKYYKHNRLMFPQHMIRDKNKLEMFFRSGYSNDGEGLFQYNDCEDRKQYIFSNFCNFTTHSCFPCFDQPNIKASYRLFLFVPSLWNAIFNTTEELFQNGEDSSTSVMLKKFGLPSLLLENYEYSSNFYMFRETKPQDTYQVSLNAGQFQCFACNKEIKMRIFCRLSMKVYLEQYAQDLFSFMFIAYQRFKEYLEMDFPFTKLDVIFVPNLRQREGEFMATISLSENLFLFYNKYTYEQKSNLIYTIIAQVASMWINHITILRWWDDLWFSRGLSLFLSLFLVEETPQLKYNLGWTLHCIILQRYSYKLETIPHARPLYCVVDSTNGMTLKYGTLGKCISLLKQLYFILGKEKFRCSVIGYLKQFKNECYNPSFMWEKEANKFPIDITHYWNAWFKTKGYNTLIPKYEIKDGQISKFEVIQECCGDEVLRCHYISISLFYFSNKEIVQEYPSIWIKNQRATSIDTFIGLPAPDAILLDSQSSTYAVVMLDEHSYRSFFQNVHKISKRLTLQLILFTMYNMVAKGKQNPYEFLNFIYSILPQLQCANSSVCESIRYIRTIVTHILPDSMYEKYRKKSFQVLLSFHKSLINDKVLNYDMMYGSLKALIHMANTPPDIQCLFEFLENTLKFEIPLKLKHLFFIKLCTLSDVRIKDKEPLDYVEAQLENEFGDEAIKVRKACEAALPDASMKRALILDEYLNPEECDYPSMVEYSMKYLRQKCQEDLLKDVDRVIYENIKEVKKLPSKIAMQYITFVFPSYHSEMNLWQLSNLEKEINDKKILEAIEIKKYKISKSYQIKNQTLKYQEII